MGSDVAKLKGSLMNLHLSREQKLDAMSALAGIGGIGLAVAASELTLPILMGVGTALVGGVAIARVIAFRAKARHDREDEQEVRGQEAQKRRGQGGQEGKR